MIMHNELADDFLVAIVSDLLLCALYIIEIQSIVSVSQSLMKEVLYTQLRLLQNIIMEFIIFYFFEGKPNGAAIVSHNY